MLHAGGSEHASPATGKPTSWHISSTVHVGHLADGGMHMSVQAVSAIPYAATPRARRRLGPVRGYEFKAE